MSGTDEDKDLLGRTYEYCIQQFAAYEGTKGGEFYTPQSIVKTIVEVLKPFDNCRVYDPACGSGNFLTETYISLRRLENEVLRGLTNQITMFTDFAPIKVSIGQFYGIEINDFAVTVAKTALWIAESQMMKETEDILHTDLDFLPLKSYANITEGNALRIDWETVVPKDKLNYIMGNPPFVGYKLQTIEQKKDLIPLYKDSKNIDYVAGWYWKASEFMQGTSIRAALVSTNSITRGDL